MLLEPFEYENIIIAIRFENKYNWCISDKDIWIMDGIKERDACIKKAAEMGIKYNCDDLMPVEERVDIEVLSEKNASIFLKRIEKCFVTTEELKNLLAHYLENDSVDKREFYYRFMPSLFVDFDKCILYSMYPEPMSFEDYVPDGWKGYYGSFIDKLDPVMNYWSRYFKYENER